MGYENVLLEKLEGGVYLLTINRPKVLNALDGRTLDEVGMAAEEVSSDPDARAMVVTGAGDKAFVAGADISAMRDFTGEEGRAFGQRGLRAFRKLELVPVPVIAAVNGYCLGGGCELAMSCDWIVASDTAVFGQPEVSLAVTPGFGGTQRLTRLVGSARALDILTTGRNVKADEALRIGLATAVVPAGELMETVMKTAGQIASKGPLAVRMAKEVVVRGQDLDLDNACYFESQVFGLSFATEDQKEGMGAFLDKRKADFRGR